MKLMPFALERIQSEWEHIVKYNLTESGVAPLSITDLLGDDLHAETLLSTKMGYPQTNGTSELRSLISSPYSAADEENVVVTNGGAEANFLAAWNLFHESEGKDLVMMLPNYMQINGVWESLGGKVRPFYLRVEKGEWVPDVEQLKGVISKETAAIAICNPNNPTGAVLDKGQLKTIAEIAEDAGVYVLSDEVYRGAELSGLETPSFFDIYDRVMVTSSLSKVYALPGLRLGWVISSSKKKANELWSYSDYTSICPSMLSDILARAALQPKTRSWILERTRRIVKTHWSIMRAWLDSHADIFEWIPPRAASICFPRYNLPISSGDLVNQILREKSVLVAPGDHFGVPDHLRFGFGYDKESLKEGLNLLSDVLREISC